MLLAIDIGNTNIVMGLFAGSELACHWRIETDPDRTADDYAGQVRGLFHQEEIEPGQVSGIVMASVVPRLDTLLCQACTDVFSRTPLLVDAATDTGLLVRYETPQTLGADRIVNAAAAYALVRGPVIVIDMGTATTFDYVDARGAYLGGAIAPGIRTAGEALFQKAAKLPPVEFEYPERVIGRTTVESMQSGIVAGYVCLVEGMIARMKQESGAAPRVIATGGLAPLVASCTTAIDEVDEHLLLRGLKIIYERQAT